MDFSFLPAELPANIAATLLTTRCCRLEKAAAVQVLDEQIQRVVEGTGKRRKETFPPPPPPGSVIDSRGARQKVLEKWNKSKVFICISCCSSGQLDGYIRVLPLYNSLGCPSTTTGALKLYPLPLGGLWMGEELLLEWFSSCILLKQPFFASGGGGGEKSMHILLHTP